jgi:hypothetical protein
MRDPCEVETRKEAHHAGLCCRRERRRGGGSCRCWWRAATGDGTTTSRTSAEAIRAMGASRSSSTASTRRDRRGGGASRAGCDHPRDDGALGTPDFRHFDRWFALTNRLRTEGTEHLLAAARRAASAVRRPELHRLEQRREGSWIKTEDDPLDPHPVTSSARRSPRSSSSSAPFSMRRSRYRRPVWRAVRAGLVGDPRRDLAESGCSP